MYMLVSTKSLIYRQLSDDGPSCDFRACASYTASLVSDWLPGDGRDTASQSILLSSLTPLHSVPPHNS